MTDKLIRGSCLCGAVEFAIPSGQGGFQYCHCSRCRKTSGSSHAANLVLPAEQFRWLRGEHRVVQYTHEPAERYCNAFCSTCGSKLPWRTRNGKWFIVTAGSLDEDPDLRPERNIFWGSRAPWYVSPDDLPLFDTVPGK